MLIQGIIIPFLGTTLGSCCVFFMNKELKASINKILIGFAAGIMTAASIWSLLIPSIEESENYGKLSFVPAVAGFLLGMFFLLLLDGLIPHLHMNTDKAEGLKSSLSKNAMMVLAVTIHNLPEGMAVGITYASLFYGSEHITEKSALALAIGIAIQNFPEGAIISMPLKSNGMGKFKAFLCGFGSGIAEPLGAILTILASGLFIPFMPYLLSFAAGAMIYVVVEELIPEMSAGEHSNKATIAFAIGFAVMMMLDVAFS